MKKIIISSLLYLLSPITSADPHSHDQRVHDHPYPTAGVQHRHGNGALGVSTNSINSTADTSAEGKAIDYYNLAVDPYNSKNYKKAAPFFEKSCSLNYDKACLRIGILYVKGDGVKKNVMKGKTLIFKAAKMGNPDAKIFVKTYNKLIAEEESKAKQEEKRHNSDKYRNACLNGDGKSCSIIGAMYHTGEGVQQDFERGNTYFEKGCSLNNANSCYIRGNTYRLLKNYNLFHRYHDKACKLVGLESGCKYKVGMPGK